jgi:alkylhydroperoxidase/carboxymuconolactone decarboxylase family protein
MTDALAVAHAVQCPYCIDAYTTGSLEKGATPEQMTEAVHVAAAIRGGASLVHGVQMRNRVEKLSM